MKSFPGARYRRILVMAAAVALPLAALAAPASGTTVRAAGETAVTAADSTSCPWLNQSLPVQIGRAHV